MTESLKTPAISTTCPLCAGSQVFTYLWPNHDETDGKAKTYTGLCSFCRGWYGDDRPEKKCTPEKISTWLNPVVAAVEHFPAYLDRLSNCVDDIQMFTDETMLAELGLEAPPTAWPPLLTLKALAYWIDYEDLCAENALNYRCGEDTDRELVYYKRLEAAIDGFQDQAAAATTDDQARAILDEHRALQAERIEQGVRRDRRLDRDQWNSRYLAFLPRVFSGEHQTREVIGDVLSEALERAPQAAIDYLAVKCLAAQSVIDSDPRFTADFKLAHSVLMGPDHKTSKFAQERHEASQRRIRQRFEVAARSIAAQTTSLGGRINLRLVQWLNCGPLALQGLEDEAELLDQEILSDYEAAVFRSLGRLQLDVPSLLRLVVGAWIGDYLFERDLTPLHMQAALSLFDELAHPPTRYLATLPVPEPWGLKGQHVTSTYEGLRAFLASYGLRCCRQKIHSYEHGHQEIVRVFNHEHELVRDPLEKVAKWAQSMAQKVSI